MRRVFEFDATSSDYIRLCSVAQLFSIILIFLSVDPGTIRVRQSGSQLSLIRRLAIHIQSLRLLNMGHPYQTQSSFLGSQAIYTCLAEVVQSMQQDLAADEAQTHVNTTLWREQDISAFVDAIHSIRHKAPNSGFKIAHFNEANKILAEKVTDGVEKTATQLSSKLKDVRSYLMHHMR
jgi:hypothetical protein